MKDSCLYGFLIYHAGRGQILLCRKTGLTSKMSIRNNFRVKFGGDYFPERSTFDFSKRETFYASFRFFCQRDKTTFKTK